MRVPKYRAHVRDLLELSEERIWRLKVPGVMDLTFDDGTVIENAQVTEVKISWYYWQIVMAYRDLSITPKLFLNGARYTDDCHRELMEAAIDETIGREDIEKEEVWLIGYRDIYNKLYNAIVANLRSFMGVTDVPHILEILFDPEVFAANDAVTDSIASCNNTHKVLRKIWETNRYPDNPTTQAFLNHTVKPAQLFQSFGSTSLRTDIDSQIYGTPIRRGFAQGFLKLQDVAKESRSASKALLFNKDPVASAEYFNRKLQFVCSRIRRIAKGDCGTQHYHEITVPDGDYGKGVMQSLAGLYEVMDDGGLREIRYGENHRCGTKIRFRTTMCCNYLPKQCVCQKCYGGASYAIPWDTNPGHVSCTAINKLITQLIISTKHLDFIVHKFMVSLKPSERFYLDVHEGDTDHLYLNKEREGLDIQMRFSVNDAKDLIKIKYVDNIRAGISISTLTSIRNVAFYIRDSEMIFTSNENYNLIKDSIPPSLSLELLEYIRDYGWDCEGDFYYVNLRNFNFSKPIMIYPLKNDNMIDYANRVERHIRSSSSAGDEDNNELVVDNTSSKLSEYRDPTSALMDTHALINEKLKGVHMGHIATILASTRVIDAENGNFSMPAGLEVGKFERHDDIIRGISLSVSMQYKEQYKVFDNLDSYIIKDRDTSPIDATNFISKTRDYTL